MSVGGESPSRSTIHDHSGDSQPVPGLRLSVLISKMGVRKPTSANGNLSATDSETRKSGPLLWAAPWVELSALVWS